MARTYAAEGPRGSALVLSASSLVGPATIIVALGVIGPLLILLRYSFNQYDPRMLMIETFTLENYVKFFTDTFYLGVFFTTLRVALTTTAVCLILGFPLAYVLARTQSRFKNLFIIAVVIPLFVGNAVRAAGWRSFARRRLPRRSKRPARPSPGCGSWPCRTPHQGRSRRRRRWCRQRL